MPLAGRVGDHSKCPVCKSDGPARQGSPDVFIDDQAALRVGDPGKDGGCAGGTWNAQKGSRSVYINGIPAFRKGDAAKYGSSAGQLVDGSPDVEIGDAGGGAAKEVPHDKSLYVELEDALGRMIAEGEALVSCPHKEDDPQKFTGSTTVTGMCSGATVTVKKPLQKGTWDPSASSGEILPPTHAQIGGTTPAAPSAPAAADSHVVHAPVSPGTPSDTHEAHIVRPTTSSATVKITTVHNWAELIFKAFGVTMPTGATEIAILGVREASLSGKGGEDALEAAAAAGESDKVTFTREQRDDVFSKDASSVHATNWNDLLFISFTTTTVAHEQQVEVFECTIDAGDVESDAGMPITLEGKLYSARPGAHIPSRYPGSDIALHLFYQSFGKMALAREHTGTRRTFEEIASAKNPAHDWKFCEIEDNSSIHMHFGSESGKVTSWSTGCTVLHHHLWIKDKNGQRIQDPKATRYKRFMELYRGAANKQSIPYLVVSSEYVRSYPEWVRLVDQTPDEAAKPESVIMKDKLVAAPGQAGRYLPSFATEKFAKDVEALAANAATSKAHAANLRSSMDLITFTVSI
jgi:uncharacterized Zn-binding protein involved in type VI secretion